MQSFDCTDFRAWNVVGYPFRRNASGMGNFDLLPTKCSRDLRRPAKFERHLPHEPAFRLDDRGMDRGAVMDAPAVGKVKGPKLTRTSFGTVANNKAGRRPALNYSVR